MSVNNAVSNKFSITNACTCEEIRSVDVGYVPASECFGCWDDDLALFESEIVIPWREANGLTEDSIVRVDFNKVGWRAENGFGLIKATTSWVISALSFGNEWRADFSLDNGVLTAVRYSHDEPVGTGVITFTEVTNDAE